MTCAGVLGPAWPGIRLVRKSESGQVGRNLGGVRGRCTGPAQPGIRLLHMSETGRCVSSGDVHGRILLRKTYKLTLTVRLL